MSTFTNPLAKIAVNKSLLKEYSNSECSRVVYMKNNSEFQIQIFNPYNYTIGADISINGNRMSNRIIIKPGQRVWLERYIDDPRKFLFSTYEVENNAEVRNAIRNNGLVSISFYKEKPYEEPIHIYKSTPNWNYDWRDYSTTRLYNNCLDSSINFCANTERSLGDVATSATAATYSVNSIQGTNTRCMAKKGLDLELSAAKPISAKIETGRIEKGSQSSQEFENVWIDFEYCSFAIETIQILPISQKPYSIKDLKKIYCTGCGRKLNTKYKYCPYCGLIVNY